MPPSIPPIIQSSVKIRVSNLSFSYNGREILRDTSVAFPEHAITAIVGPSGSGKSTFLMTLNRLWEELPRCTMSGRVEMLLNGVHQNIYAPDCGMEALRRRVAMVFQMPNPLPMSIFKNVAFPLQLAGEKDKRTIRRRVEETLRDVRLWDEVKDRLAGSALSLSGGQQQRMCMARAMILRPEILLLDEPASSLDQKAAEAIEQLLVRWKHHCTILIVSHYLDQVKRIADNVVELRDGQLRIR
ncbi:MAG: phosphate transport system ATP-binding [Desulfobulbaceae bacterium]|nr:MAG: phosphate transport system ATP-binding [Desulfobulbaceae bacterium]